MDNNSEQQIGNNSGSHIIRDHAQTTRYPFVQISNWKRFKPINTVIGLKGNPIKVTIMPAISSITIQPGSFCFSIFSAASAMHTAKRIKNRVPSIAGASEIPVRAKQSGSPIKDPNVPGATKRKPD